jgi:hypothetical protein
MERIARMLSEPGASSCTQTSSQGAATACARAARDCCDEATGVRQHSGVCPTNYDASPHVRTCPNAMVSPTGLFCTSIAEMCSPLSPPLGLRPAAGRFPPERRVGAAACTLPVAAGLACCAGGWPAQQEGPTVEAVWR